MNVKVVSREYKALLDQREFRDRKPALAAYRVELARMAPPSGFEGDFGPADKRTLVFLDTPDLTLRRLGFVLRHRQGDEGGELTLKCRSEDRYFAAGAAIFDSARPGPGEKLEEDVVAPFVARYSKSKTVPGGRPTSWGEAARTFPLLATLALDERPVPPEIPLRPVNDVEVFERVHRGPTLIFDDPGRPEGKVRSSVALILWSDGKEGRPLVAEFSFRLKDEEENYSRGLALAARGFFDRLRRHEWTLPAGRTKTQYVYGDPGLD